VHSRAALVRGDELLKALTATTVEVKWFRAGSPRPHRIDAGQALCIAKAGAYEGKARRGRVYLIREIDTSGPAPLRDEDYWRDRAMMRWYKAVDKKSVELWDRILKSLGQKRSST